jgi:hypothetical protein
VYDARWEGVHAARNICVHESVVNDILAKRILIYATAQRVYRVLVVRGVRGDPATRVDSVTFTAKP